MATVSGVLRDSNGNTINVECTVLAIDITSDSVVATTTSNTDGVFSLDIPDASGELLFAAYYEGTYNEMTDPVGVWIAKI